MEASIKRDGKDLTKISPNKRVLEEDIGQTKQIAI